MDRLSQATLASVRAGVRVPRFERAALRHGFAHLGVGAFHRGHQAEFTDDAIEAGAEDRGYVGINLHPPRLRPMLGAQDGLFSRTLREESGSETRVLGCIRGVIDAADAMQAALAAVADPAVQTLTLTVTEKGYCHVPATGLLDEDHPDIVADRDDSGGTPRSAPGFLVAALARRRALHGGGLNLVSCDNIPSNGAILRTVVTTLAAARDRDLARWIGDTVRFPSTMVDRIVPATTAGDRAAAAAALGLHDEAAVVGERYREWVLEDAFTGRRPGWDAAGARFVASVQPYEFVKMRVLNAAQTVVALAGLLAGFEYSCDGIADPALRAFVERFLAETAPTVPRAAGVDPDAYRRTTLARIANTAIRHRTAQIATDSSRKIVQRLLDPLRDNLRERRPVDCLAAAVAAFVAVRARATPQFGARWQIDDPIAPAAAQAAADAGADAEAFFARVVALRGVFGELGQDAGFLAAARAHYDGWMHSPRRHLDRIAQMAGAA